MRGLVPHDLHKGEDAQFDAFEAACAMFDCSQAVETATRSFRVSLFPKSVGNVYYTMRVCRRTEPQICVSLYYIDWKTVHALPPFQD